MPGIHQSNDYAHIKSFLNRARFSEGHNILEELNTRNGRVSLWAFRRELERRLSPDSDKQPSVNVGADYYRRLKQLHEEVSVFADNPKAWEIAKKHK
ncbi:hypothetical protein HUU53_01260 [Candidatus Micrarchaeota archaeon]|nr:hypothetical protein [Candidatus Micrarchaeota archaeon]